LSHHINVDTNQIRFAICDLNRSHLPYSASSSFGGRSNGFMYCCEFIAIFTYVHPTFSQSHLYSFSGSTTITGMPRRRYLSISSFTANDLPAPDVASTTLFAFGNFQLNLSKITSEPVCSFAP